MPARHLILSDGMAVGALCVLDRVPRVVAAEQQSALRTLRDQVVRLLEIRRNEAELKRSVAAQGKVQQQLHETERRFFQFLDAVPVGVFVIDKDGNPYYANQEAQALLGKGIVSQAGTRDLADTYQAYVTGGSQEYPASRMPIVRALSGERSTVSDMEIHRGGNVVPVQVWGAPILDDVGKVAYAIVAFSDLLDRRKTERRLSAVCAVGWALSESTQLSEAGERIIRAVCEAMQWDVGVLWEVDRRENVLHCVNFWHKPSHPVPEFETLTHQFRYPPGFGLPGRVWSSGKPAWIENVAADTNFPRLPAALKNNLHGAFAFPIVADREVIGVIEFFSAGIEEPDVDLLAMLGSLGAQVGQFMARKKAERELARLAGPS
jgi:PAS domain-containing protein